MKYRAHAFVLVVVLGQLAPAPAPAPRPILDYIKQTWTTLTRSNRTIAMAAVDPKSAPGRDGRWPVYLPAGENRIAVEAALRRQLSPADLGKVVIRTLSPEEGNQGLLYLPNPYVVPGGRFNEMYGWDSYFIQLGLLRDGLIPLAKGMTDNFRYQIRHYGAVLNANRTYYLTRSQPPFFTSMVLGVYRQTHDRKWLADSVPAIDAYYRYWTSGSHLTETGLSRYWDSGEGPAPEVLSSERDEAGRTHYDRVREYYRTHDVTDYEITQYYDKATDRLTPLFYKGDRSMRESGFDPSNRFGPFNVDIIHYNPVCLNSLLYLMEKNAAEIATVLGRASDAAVWARRAQTRADLVNRLLWDEAAGLYLDYDFTRKQRRNYAFLTTFWPLWVGIATPDHAARVVRNLPLFEQPGGLQTSTTRTGSQWDAPFGWAPLQLIATQALRRYGFSADADRVAEKFLTMVAEQYRQTGIIVEKYDVTKRGSEVADDLKFGYRSNEPGFGWTNAAFVVMLDELPAGAGIRNQVSGFRAGPGNSAAGNRMKLLLSRPHPSELIPRPALNPDT
jgi:alpha,alpha-trehalase